jgi:hypothetical protein
MLCAETRRVHPIPLCGIGGEKGGWRHAQSEQAALPASPLTKVAQPGARRVRAVETLDVGRTRARGRKIEA